MKRLAQGGRIDRKRPLEFLWDDRRLAGYAGDTLASALLGAGVTVIGTSVTAGRPRGIMSAGFEEAHGFAQVGTGGASEPLVRMMTVPLEAGLVARSRITKGYLPTEPDPGRFEKRYAHADLLVVGGGPAGLAAARLGARAGARVILVEADLELGGSLLREQATLDGLPAMEWVGQVAGELRGAPDVRILTRATAAIALDQGGMIVTERGSGSVEGRVWQVRAAAVIVATGALERPIVFADNDRPGIMLAGGARSYANRHAVAPERAVVFTTNDVGYRTALDYRAHGVDVALVVDPRPRAPAGIARQVESAGVPVVHGAVVTGTAAGSVGELRAVTVQTESGETRVVECDLLAVSGGFDPALGLHQQRRGATRWDQRTQSVVPDGEMPGQWIAGAAAGRVTLDQALADGADAAHRALERLGRADTVPVSAPVPMARAAELEPAELWSVPAPDGDESRSFVDLHRDVTVAGLDRALGTGIRHIEHVKRYTLIGTGVEQGRASKVAAGALTARGIGRPVSDVGTSGTRPPVEPILFHAMGGRAKGARYEPVRTTAIHPEHVAAGAVFEPVGQWLRPQYFPRAGESREAAGLREGTAVRERVGMMDASTLGKIDVHGPDAARFLDRLYVNPIASLEPGRARYSVMCRLDGSVFDDGVVIRLAPDRFFVTTTTGNAAPVLEWMEEWLQTEWPDLEVWLTSITEEWATVAIAGPQSRAVVERLLPGADWTNEGFGFMHCRRAQFDSVDALVARVSFSGELAFEVSVPARHGAALWRAVAAAGQPSGIAAYGMDALHVLRAEKGYFIGGQETDGRTIPADLGLSWMIAKKKDFVGKRSFALPANTRPDRFQLVGLLPENPDVVVPEGGTVVADPTAPRPMEILGHVTASHRSVALGRTFALAMVRGGTARKDHRLFVLADGRSEAVVVTDAVLYDPKGARRDG